MLTKWGYWQIVDDRKDADFTMKINIVKPSGNLISRNYNATADFIDKNNSSIFTTKEVTVLDRDVAVNALIDKRIKQDRND